VAKSKHAPALFEVIDRSKTAKTSGGKLSIPKWWKSGTTAKPQAVPDQEESVPEPPQEYETAPSAPPAETLAINGGDSPIDTDDEPRPILCFRSGRMVISLNPVSAIVTIGVLVVLMLICYHLGGMSAPSSSGSDNVATAGSDGLSFEDVVKQPINPSVITKQVKSSGSDGKTGNTKNKPSAEITLPAGTTAEPGKRIPGLMYVMLESFGEKDLDRRNQAEQAMNWLSKEKNIETTLEPQGNRLALIGTTGYKTRKEAERYRDVIISVGREYKKKFGAAKARYDFHDPFIFTE